eukprot:jgi/Chrzof1/9309/UNPLg00277.t1
MGPLMRVHSVSTTFAWQGRPLSWKKEEQHKDTLDKLRSLQYRVKYQIWDIGITGITQRHDGSSHRPRGNRPNKTNERHTCPHKSLTPTCRATPCRGLNPCHPGGLVTPRPSGVIFIDFVVILFVRCPGYLWFEFSEDVRLANQPVPFSVWSTSRKRPLSQVSSLRSENPDSGIVGLSVHWGLYAVVNKSLKSYFPSHGLLLGLAKVAGRMRQLAMCQVWQVPPELTNGISQWARVINKWKYDAHKGVKQRAATRLPGYMPGGDSQARAPRKGSLLNFYLSLQVWKLPCTSSYVPNSV